MVTVFQLTTLKSIDFVKTVITRNCFRQTQQWKYYLTKLEKRSFYTLNSASKQRKNSITQRSSWFGKKFVVLVSSVFVIGAGAMYSKADPTQLRLIRVYTGGIGRFIRSLRIGMTISMDYWWCMHRYDESDVAYEENMHECHLRAANRLVDCCLANGGLYVKLGQGLVSFDYLLPREYIATLTVLQDKALPRKVDEVRDLFIEDFGQSPSQVFATFEEEPIAAGSLAQVHLATTASGDKLAVKVQYIDLQDRYASDIWTVKVLLDIIAWMHPSFGFKWALEDLKTTLAQELDFVNEGRNAERCLRDLQHLNFVHVPKVYWNYTTKRVLTAEYIDGCKISDVDGIAKLNLQLKDVDEKLIKIFGEQIFHTGFVHADPHPGNVFVRRGKQSGQAELILLDHGLYQQLPDKTRTSLCYLWKNIILNNAKLMEKYSKELDVENYKLFCGVLLQRPIERPRIKLPNRLTEQDVTYMREMVQKRFDDIMLSIKCMPRPMLLVLRNLNTVRAIVATHNYPVDRHLIMARIATRGIFRSASSFRCIVISRWEQFVFNFKLSLETLTLMFIRTYLKILIRLGRSPDSQDIINQLH